MNAENRQSVTNPVMSKKRYEEFQNKLANFIIEENLRNDVLNALCEVMYTPELGRRDFEIYHMIKKCTCTSSDIAHIAAKIFNRRFVCPDPSSSVWFQFTGTLWEKDQKLEIFNCLAYEVTDHFIMALKKLRDEEANSEDDENKKIGKKILKSIGRLSESSSKKAIVEDLCDILFDESFYSKLDNNPNLLAFNNGVMELDTKTFRNATPEDCVSLSVGYDYMPIKNEEAAKIVDQYWKSLHPHEDQRLYIIKAIARQLYGDSGGEIHIHAGNTSFFEVLSYALGDYVYKFGVQHLTAVKRKGAHKPSPELANWQGRRILYCTVPSQKDVLNSGILKDYSGNERLNYRLRYSNQYISFMPQFCMHIMCNEPPKIKGECEGIKRRIRKIDYPNDIDESQYTSFSQPEMKMEFIRYLIDHYEHDFRFIQPDIVKENSKMYLEENDHQNT